MRRFVVGDDRSQSTLFPERLDEYLDEDNPVRATFLLMILILVISASAGLSRRQREGQPTIRRRC
jgi:hypothetical protein